MEYSKQADEDPKVTVSCMGNNYFSPCTTPLTLKLQTYLRMTDIKYKVQSCVMSNKKQKIPFINFNGDIIEDTRKIIDLLNSEFGKNLNEHLSLEEKATALKFREMVEANLHWSLEYQRWVLDDDIASTFPLENCFMRFGFSMMLRWCIRPTLKAEMIEHGVWSENSEDITQSAAKLLSTISEYLEDKPFFMGKQPSEVDATLFGFLAPVYYNMKGSPSGRYMVNELPNLVSYVQRMREVYWPDWDALCSPRPVKCGKSKEAALEQGALAPCKS